MEPLDKSSSSKVLQDLSVCSSDFEVIGSHFNERKKMIVKMRVKYYKARCIKEAR